MQLWTVKSFSLLRWGAKVELFVLVRQTVKSGTCPLGCHATVLLWQLPAVGDACWGADGAAAEDPPAPLLPVAAKQELMQQIQGPSSSMGSSSNSSDSQDQPIRAEQPLRRTQRLRATITPEAVRSMQGISTAELAGQHTAQQDAGAGAGVGEACMHAHRC